MGSRAAGGISSGFWNRADASYIFHDGWDSGCVWAEGILRVEFFKRIFSGFTALFCT